MNRFDELEAQTIWLSAAMAGHPYRGTGYNIGYRRSLFFDAKGFSRSLTLHHGEDDIFISQIATPGNTAAVVDPAATIAVNRYMPVKALRDLRMQHTFTGRFISKGAPRLFGFSTIMLWVWLAATATGVVMSLPNLLPSCVFLAAAIGLWTPLIAVWRHAARAQEMPLNAWALGPHPALPSELRTRLAQKLHLDSALTPPLLINNAKSYPRSTTFRLPGR